jgi:hypothetical protein
MRRLPKRLRMPAVRDILLELRGDLTQSLTPAGQELDVRWPSGNQQRFLGLAGDQRLRIEEGEPAAAPAAGAREMQVRIPL